MKRRVRSKRKISRRLRLLRRLAALRKKALRKSEVQHTPHSWELTDAEKQQYLRSKNAILPGEISAITEQVRKLRSYTLPDGTVVPVGTGNDALRRALDAYGLSGKKSFQEQYFDIAARDLLSSGRVERLREEVAKARSHPARLQAVKDFEKRWQASNSETDNLLRANYEFEDQLRNARVDLKDVMSLRQEADELVNRMRQKRIEEEKQLLDFETQSRQREEKVQDEIARLERELKSLTAKEDKLQQRLIQTGESTTSRMAQLNTLESRDIKSVGEKALKTKLKKEMDDIKDEEDKIAGELAQIETAKGEIELQIEKANRSLVVASSRDMDLLKQRIIDDDRDVPEFQERLRRLTMTQRKGTEAIARREQEVQRLVQEIERKLQSTAKDEAELEAIKDDLEPSQYRITQFALQEMRRKLLDARSRAIGNYSSFRMLIPEDYEIGNLSRTLGTELDKVQATAMKKRGQFTFMESARKPPPTGRPGPGMSVLRPDADAFKPKRLSFGPTPFIPRSSSTTTTTVSTTTATTTTTTSGVTTVSAGFVAPTRTLRPSRKREAPALPTIVASPDPSAATSTSVSTTPIRRTHLSDILGKDLQSPIAQAQQLLVQRPGFVVAEEDDEKYDGDGEGLPPKFERPDIPYQTDIERRMDAYEKRLLVQQTADDRLPVSFRDYRPDAGEIVPARPPPAPPITPSSVVARLMLPAPPTIPLIADSSSEDIGDVLKKRGGAKIAKEGLFDQQIDDMMKGYDDYAGSISYEELPRFKLPKNRPSAFVVNLDKEDGPGYHWVAMFFDPRPGKASVEYYDSYGEDPPKLVQAAIDETIEKNFSDLPYMLKYKTNGIKRQSDSTNSCGFFALKFLQDRLDGVPFIKASGYTASCVAQGERMINQVKKKFGYK